MKPYYEEAGIVIYHGDCREVLPSLGGCVDLVLTDPPYSPHVHAKEWIGKALTDAGDVRCGTAFTELGFDPLTPELRKLVCEMAFGICPRWTLAFCDLESAHLWREDLAASGLDYIRTLIWDKVDSAPQFTGDRPANAAEAIVCAHHKGKKVWNGGGARNVLRYAVNAERGAKPHPSTKPLPLIQKLMGWFSDLDGVVLDPFMGSGTTLRAAKDLGRRAIGIELEEKYCEIAARRLCQEVLAL